MHPHSLIRVFADRMCLLQPLGYPKKGIRRTLAVLGDVQADLSLCWLHRSYCRFCRALAHIDSDQTRLIGVQTIFHSSIRIYAQQQGRQWTRSNFGIRSQSIQDYLPLVIGYETRTTICKFLCRAVGNLAFPIWEYRKCWNIDNGHFRETAVSHKAFHTHYSSVRN